MNTGFIGRLHSPATTSEYSNAKDQLWKLNLAKGEEVKIIPLTDLSKGWDVLALHFVAGKPSEICEGMYPDCDVCVRCNEPSPFGDGNMNNPTFAICILCYVLDHVGKIRTSQKTGKEYAENPIKILEVTSGAGGAEKGINFEALRQYNTAGLMQDVVWKIKRNEKKGLNPPEVVDERLLGNQYKKGIPEDIKTLYDGKSAGECKGIILSAYGNYRAAHPVFKQLGVITPADSMPVAAGDVLD